MKNVLAVLGIIVGIIILLFIIVMVSTVILVNSNNAYKGDKQQLLKGSNGKKALVVYQPSISSTSKALGESLAKGINEAGYEVTVSYPGKHLSGDVSGYDVIVMGTTVYAAQPSKMLMEYAQTVTGIEEKRVLLYSLGAAPEMPELDTVQGAIKNATNVKKHKFMANEEPKTAAYQLGLNIDKE